MDLVLLISPNRGQGRGSKNPENLRDILYGWSLKPTTSYSPLDSLAVERKPAILSEGREEHGISLSRTLCAQDGGKKRGRAGRGDGCG